MWRSAEHETEWAQVQSNHEDAAKEMVGCMVLEHQLVDYMAS